MRLAEAIRRANTVYLAGNGGSYANAVHIANDLKECGIRAYALDGPTLTAWANDYGYEYVFARWMRKVGRKGDLLIVLSGSGRSPNILNGLKAAQEIGITTYAIVGAYNAATQAAAIAEYTTTLGSDMQEAEEMQLWLGHQAMKELRKESECAL